LPQKLLALPVIFQRIRKLCHTVGLVFINDLFYARKGIGRVCRADSWEKHTMRCFQLGLYLFPRGRPG
jgi:hypothetical protein